MPDDPNVYDAARLLLHDLRGQLTVIYGAADLLRDATLGPLNAAQRGLVDRIDATATELLAALDAQANPILNALALAPAAGRIWPVRHLTELPAALATIARDHPLPASGGQALLVAPTDLLPGLRRALGDLDWTTRLATAPVDIEPMARARPVDLLLLAPPPGEALAWWRMARTCLFRVTRLPALVEFTPRS